MKRLLGITALVLACNAQAYDLPNVVECTPLPDPNPQYTMKAMKCSVPNVPAQLPYRMKDGSTQVLGTHVLVRYKDTVCQYLDNKYNSFSNATGEYAGSISDRNIVVAIQMTLGYYIGNAADGRIVAYAKGGGPEAGEPAAPALSAPAVSSLDACVEQWGQAFRKEEGELAVATVYHLQEWEQLCQDGKQP